MAKNVIGFVLVDAPHSALNNSGSDAGERTDNAVKVKIIRKGYEIFPYVSGQAWRYWWRSALENKFNWNMSPIERAEKIAFTEADPFEYPDDDTFGYMRAPKKDKKKGNKGEESKRGDSQSSKGVTLTRSSPLKNSPLVSVLSQRPTDDFGTMSRQKDGDPVPYEHQFYSTVLKGIFSLDLDSVGRFSSINKSGFKNLSEIDNEKLDKYNAKVKDDLAILPREIRVKRSRDIINSLQYLSGGAKQSSHLTDVTPKLVLLSCIDGGNHPFMNLVREKDKEVYFDFDAFKQTVMDYSDSFLTSIYVGQNKGFIDNLIPKFEELSKDDVNGVKIIYKSVGDSINSFSEEIEKLME